MEIEIGDTVRITNEGQLYSTWDTMIDIWKLRWDYSKHRKLLKNGTIGTVIRVGNHEQSRGTIILGIGTPIFDFIIGSDGVELISKGVEETYKGEEKIFDVKNLFLE